MGSYGGYTCVRVDRAMSVYTHCIHRRHSVTDSRIDSPCEGNIYTGYVADDVQVP